MIFISFSFDYWLFVERVQTLQLICFEFTKFKVLENNQIFKEQLLLILVCYLQHASVW